MKPKELADKINEHLRKKYGEIEIDQYITPSRINSYRKDLIPLPLKAKNKNHYDYSQDHFNQLFAIWSLTSIKGIKKRVAIKTAREDLNLIDEG